QRVPRGLLVLPDAILHGGQDMGPKEVPHDRDIALRRLRPPAVGPEEGGPIPAAEPSAGEDIEAGPLALPDVPFRRSANPPSDDSRSAEIVTILESNCEGPRVLLHAGPGL